MKISVCKDMVDLIRLIGTFRPSPEDRGTVVGRVLLWDGRIVDALCVCDPVADLETTQQSFPSEQLVDLAGFVYRMLSIDLDFVTRTGHDDQLCALKWQIVRVVHH